MTGVYTSWGPSSDKFMSGYPGSYSSGLGQHQVSVGRHSGGNGPWSNFRDLSLSEKRELFFGRPVRESSGAAEDQYLSENRIKPFAWIGRNMRIQTTLIRRIEAADDFIIRRVLPLQQIPEGGKIVVSQLEFSNHSLDDIPEQGTGRLTTSSFKSWEYTIKRKGLGFMMEDGFAMTDAGIESYAASIVQISNATTDTMVLDAFYNLLTVPAAAADYYQQFGITHNDATRDDLFDYEKRLWSILSRTEYGWWKMGDMGREVFNIRRITPDVLILPAGTQSYLKRNRPETIDYSRIGPAGPDNFLSARGYITKMDGLEVYESALYNMSDSELPEDPLIRDRSIGEFGDSNFEDNRPDDSDLRKYSSALRDRTIHDNLTDQWRTLRLKDLFHASGLFDGDDLSEDVGIPFFAGCTSVGDYLQKHGMLDIVLKTYNLKKAGEDLTSVLPTLGNAHGSFMSESYGESEPMQQPVSSLKTFGKGSAAPSDSSLDTGGAANKTIQTYDLSASDMKDLAQYNSQTAFSDLLSNISKTGNNECAHCFAAYSKSGASAEQRKFTGYQISTMRDALSELYGSNGYEQIKVLPWVQFLRMTYANPAKQQELYMTSGLNTGAAADFLQMIHGNASGAKVQHTGSAFVSTLQDENLQSYMTTSFGGVTVGNGNLSDMQAYAEMRKHINIYQNRYPAINQYIPGFLPAAFVWLTQSQKSTESAIKLINNHLIPLLTWITENVDRPSGTVAKKVLTTDAASHTKLAREMLHTLSREVNDGATLMAVINWYSQQQTENLDLDRLPVNYKLPDLEATPVAVKAGTRESNIRAKLFDSKSFNRKMFEYLIDNNLPFPIDFVFARPSMNYEMGSAIMMKGGLETGATFFGDGDFQLSNEGNRKVLFGFFTCYAGARVYKPLNVHVLHNISCKRYIGGGGVRLFNNVDAMDRNSFAEGRTNGKDLFVIPMFPGEKIDDTKFDLTGEFPDEMNGNNGPPRLHYSMAHVMRHLWGFHHRDNYFDIEYFGSPVNSFNTICFRMHQFMPSIARGNFEPRGMYKMGQGHWGPNVYPGVREDRCGKGHGHVREVDWSRTSVQV